MLWSASSHFPHPYPWQLPVYILVLWVQLFCIPHVNVIIQYLSFQVWPISLSIMPFSFIHVVANDRISFFLMTEYCSVIQTHTHTDTDFSDGSVVTSKRCKWCGFDPGVGKIPWRKKWKPTPAFLPGESHGGAWLATVHGVTKRWTRLSDLARQHVAWVSINQAEFF